MIAAQTTLDRQSWMFTEADDHYYPVTTHLSSILRRIGTRSFSLVGRGLQEAVNPDDCGGISGDADDAIRHQQGLGSLVEENYLARASGGTAAAKASKGRDNHEAEAGKPQAEAERPP